MLRQLLLLTTLCLSVAGCYKTIDLEKNPIPGNTLALEFATPVKFVMDLKIDGQEIPVKYGSKNRVLMVEGLSPGKHTVDVHSVSYVYGPEHASFTVDDSTGAYLFIQARKYRSSTPKNKARISIRAYRKQIKKQGIDVKEGVVVQSDENAEYTGRIRAHFQRHR